MKANLKLLFTGMLILGCRSWLLGQCTITDATGCVCPNGQNACDLLPDITISWYALDTYQSGPMEYSQTGNGANNGKLRITGSTPSIGYGPFAVRSIDDNGDKTIVCGTDTFIVPGSSNFVCPNGETPKQILRQRIYQKNGNAMTYREHLTPPLTYSNSNMYVDDWGVFSLRLEIPAEPDPKKWPVVGTGKKRAYCLMDYGSCSGYNGHCRDDNTVYQGGNILVDASFPNFGLGNNYGCDPFEQGISSGFTDIYSAALDGMWITIPPNTCNGDYWIYYEVDPHNYFEESNENNNFTMIPVTLSLQNSPGNPVATISSSIVPALCGNDSVTLTANAGFSYLWSNGATTQEIKVPAGSYQVTVSDYCGTATSPSFAVVLLPTPSDPVTTGDSICIGGTAVLSATGNDVSWFDQNDSLVGTGNTYTTSPLASSTTYFAQDIHNIPGALAHCGKADSSGGGGYFTGSQYLIFTAIQPFLLKSVKVYSNAAGYRTIEILNNAGQLLQSGSFYIPQGAFIVPCNFNIPQGVDLRISVSGTPNLWRSNAGISYPYTVTDTLSITGSSAGANFYYFFYDWEIEVGHSSCSSAKIPATAIVDICSGVDYDLVDQLIDVYPNPATGNFTVDLLATHHDRYGSMTVADLSGRQWYTADMVVTAGKRSKLQINTATFPKGVLIVKLMLNERTYYRKLIVL